MKKYTLTDPTKLINAIINTLSVLFITWIIISFIGINLSNFGASLNGDLNFFTILCKNWGSI